MTAGIGSTIVRSATQELPKLGSFWAGRTLFAKVSVPDVVPPESGFSNWAHLLADSVKADGFITLGKPLEAAALLQRATEKPVIAQIILSGKTEQDLEELRAEGSHYNIAGYFFASGPNSSVSVERALQIFNKGSIKPVLGSSLVIPTESANGHQALIDLAKKIHHGCSMIVTSPWVDPQESQNFLGAFRREYGDTFAHIYQGLCPFEEPSQWQHLDKTGLKISPEIGKDLDLACQSQNFPKASLERECKTLQQSREFVEGSCVDLSMVRDMEEVITRLKKI
ncbi:MAG: hypothetical protein JSR37_08285 [Verrucomicrobia bacterium]|nr:hypothetical protein [Verrucomicrobiota bacterium]